MERIDGDFDSVEIEALAELCLADVRDVAARCEHGKTRSQICRDCGSDYWNKEETTVGKTKKVVSEKFYIYSPNKGGYKEAKQAKRLPKDWYPGLEDYTFFRAKSELDGCNNWIVVEASTGLVAHDNYRTLCVYRKDRSVVAAVAAVKVFLDRIGLERIKETIEQARDEHCSPWVEENS